MPKLILAALFLLCSGVTSEAHDRRAVAGPHYYAPDPIQGVGCYWARQRYICARYCYWQPDGRRYCVERERQARREYVPAPVAPPFYDWPMK